MRGSEETQSLRAKQNQLRTEKREAKKELKEVKGSLRSQAWTGIARKFGSKTAQNRYTQQQADTKTLKNMGVK